MLNKRNIIVIIFVVLVVLGLGFYAYKANNPNFYSVVYLTTGEVYVGKLSTFPDLQLKDSYILQVTKDATDPNKNNFQLNPIKEALWAPKSMHLIKDSIVFYGRLLPNSKIAETIATQAK